MKKILSLLLAVVLCVCLVACGTPEEKGNDTPATAQTTPVAPTTPAATLPAMPTEPAMPEDTEPAADPVNCISMGDTIENSKFSMTFTSLELADEYEYKTGDHSSSSLYVEPGYKLLILHGHFENLSTAVISDSAFYKVVTINNEYTITGFDVRMNFQRSKYFEIDPYTDMDYVIYVNVPEKLAAKFESAEFVIGFKDDMSYISTVYNSDGTVKAEVDQKYSLTSGLGTAEENAAAVDVQTPAVQNLEIVIGQTVSTEDFDFTLNNVELTYELKPKNTSSVYTSYTAPDGKVYIHVDGTYYNKAKKDVCIRDLFTPNADYDNGYAYKGFAVVDKGDNSFDWVSSYVVATPLESCHYHGLIECPKVVDGSDAPLIVTLEIGGETYTYTIR